jgi:hypothetical protein
VPELLIDHKQLGVISLAIARRQINVCFLIIDAQIHHLIDASGCAQNE